MFLKNSKLIKTVANKRCSLSDLNRCPFAGTDFKSVVSTYSTKRAGTYYGSSCKVMRRILDVLLANQLINIVALSMTNQRLVFTWSLHCKQCVTS